MKSTHITAFAIAIVVVVWLGSGQLKSEQTSGPESQLNTAEAEAELPETRVRARIIEAEPHQLDVLVRGRTETKRIVDVRAETNGRVIALPVEKGELVKKGDVLCKIALDDRAIRLEQAKASLIQAQLEYDGARKLAKSGHQSETNVAGAKARLSSAKATLKRSELDLLNITIRSPFDGIVEDRPVNIGDLLERSGICARILDPDPMLVVGYVAEKDVQRLQLGGQAKAVLVTGETVNGTISFISHAAETATRTYRVELEVPNADNQLRDGITAEIYVPTTTVMAHRVSPALLSLDDTGDIGIRIVDDEDIVHFINITVVGNTQEGVWVSGLPDKTRLITVGQELVFHGQKADVVMETEAL
ncbi:MAG: efflux RND transporter periplasmic adaptor subunit [Pseudomonadota bacterium]